MKGFVGPCFGQASMSAAPARSITSAASWATFIMRPPSSGIGRVAGDVSLQMRSSSILSAHLDVTHMRTSPHIAGSGESKRIVKLGPRHRRVSYFARFTRSAT